MICLIRVSYIQSRTYYCKYCVTYQNVKQTTSRLLPLCPTETRTMSQVAVRLVEYHISDVRRSWSTYLSTADCQGLHTLAGNELRQELQQWISPPDPSVNSSTACDAHHEGTVAWCIQGNPFTRWSASGSLLWIHGNRTYIHCPLSLYRR